MTVSFPSLRMQTGFTYIGVLVLVAITGLMAAATADLWRTERKREIETELLFIGDQYRQAIGKYYNENTTRGRSFPLSLQDLLQDPRTPGAKRYLRKLFLDPVTDSEEWGLVKGPAGEIMGVFSRSEAMPLKTGNFRRSDAKFEGKQKYSEWVFIYTPNQTSQQLAPTKPGAPVRARTSGSSVPR